MNSVSHEIKVNPYFFTDVEEIIGHHVMSHIKNRIILICIDCYAG